MKKTLLIVGALLLATSASSAFAQGYRPYYGGQSYYGGSDYNGGYARQLREERRDARVHQELDALHADEHYQGLDSRGDHRDLHDSIEEAHDAYHYDHPGVGYSGSNPSRYGGYGYGNAPSYGYGNYSGYGNGMSFGFSYGR